MQLLYVQLLGDLARYSHVNRTDTVSCVSHYDQSV